MSEELLKVEYIKLDDLKLYERNTRTHGEDQIDQLCRAIEEYGFTNPVLIDEKNELIAGHGRRAAAAKLGMTEVPAIRLVGLSDAKKRALRIADNQLALNAGWDEALLKLEIADLKEEDFDLELLGFSEEELNTFLEFGEEEKGSEVIEDAGVVETPADPITEAGDLWILGEHRLLCGDSTKPESFELLMQGEKADVVFTSPPYNANTQQSDGDCFSHRPKKKLYGEGYADDLESDEYVTFAKTVLDLCFTHTEGFIFWNVSYNANSRFEYIKQIEAKLDHLIEQVCWKKNSTIPFKGSMMRDWEPIYVFSTDGRRLGLETVVSNFWPISNTNSQTSDHKACFPVALPAKGIALVKPQTGIVLEPFGGSGTTIIAAESLGRRCYAIELDPKYCDVIIKRWQTASGGRAVRADGVAFDDLATRKEGA